MGARLISLLAMGAAAGTVAGAVLRYRWDLAAAWERLGSVERHVIVTRFGAVEYAVAGAGDPLLISHCGLGGCDAIATLAEVVTAAGARAVVPSRFGYLGSSLPEEATAADQADVFVELLDHLDVAQTDVLALAAGTSAAVQMALRHPDRVRRLVVVSGNWPGSPTADAPADTSDAGAAGVLGAGVVFSDPAMWTMRVLSQRWPMVARSMGIPDGFPRGAADAAEIDLVMDRMFPSAPRRAGAVLDTFRTNVEINDYPLEAVTVPTLVVHAVDDPLTSYEAAVTAVSRIPGARLVSFESGGHLLLGQSERLSREMDAFLGALIGGRTPQPPVRETGLTHREPAHTPVGAAERILIGARSRRGVPAVHPDEVPEGALAEAGSSGVSVIDTTGLGRPAITVEYTAPVPVPDLSKRPHRDHDRSTECRTHRGCWRVPCSALTVSQVVPRSGPAQRPQSRRR